MSERIQRLSERGEFLLVIALSFTYFVATSLYALFARVPELELNSARVLRAIAIELAILGTVAAILKTRGWTRERLGLRYTPLAAVAGVPLAMVFLMAYSGLSAIALALAPRLAEMKPFEIRPTAPFLLLLLFFVVNSLFEETLVAGYVVAATDKHGAAFAITASTLLRFLYHLYQGPLGAISIIPIGLIFAAVFHRYRTLWPLFVAHTIVNLLAFAAVRR